MTAKFNMSLTRWSGPGGDSGWMVQKTREVFENGIQSSWYVEVRESPYVPVSEAAARWAEALKKKPLASLTIRKVIWPDGRETPWMRLMDPAQFDDFLGFTVGATWYVGEALDDEMLKRLTAMG